MQALNFLLLFFNLGKLIALLIWAVFALAFDAVVACLRGLIYLKRYLVSAYQSYKASRASTQAV